MTGRTGLLSTPAGGGAEGPLGDGSPAASASVSDPCGITTDAAHNLVIADAGDNRIRVVAHRTGTFYGQAMTAGDNYTIAGDGTGGYSGDGGPAIAAQLDDPDGLALVGSDIVITDRGNSRIREITG
ncbi:MAG TPA: hypothetical protein VGH27_17965 [Streptosporangiaceae bacterium]|jgi:hypothetical protein